MNRFPTRQSQRGAALAVGLFMLLMLTIIGLTAVRSTTQQGRMASNFQFQNSAFQAAEGAIRGLVAEMRGELPQPAGVTVNVLVDAIDPSTANPTRSYTLGTNITSQATVQYIGQAPAPGYSMGVGKGAIVAHRFAITATGAQTNTSAQAQHQQGVQRVGPGF